MNKLRLKSNFLTSVRLLLLALLFAPIGVYIYIFGINISDDHARWAEMGSAMSGIYGPILTVLTLTVLVVQVKMQADSHKHILDQTQLQMAHGDLTFYLCRLELQLKEPMSNGISLNSFLQEWFMFAEKEALLQPTLYALADEFRLKHPTIQATWRTILAIYAGLQVVKEGPYELHYSTGKSKAVALLSYGTCAALDNYIWCESRGMHHGPYCFGVMQPSS